MDRITVADRIAFKAFMKSTVKGDFPLYYAFEDAGIVQKIRIIVKGILICVGFIVLMAALIVIFLWIFDKVFGM